MLKAWRLIINPNNTDLLVCVDDPMASVRNEDQETPEWRRRTANLLNRTAPFDSSTAIYFVAEGLSSDKKEEEGDLTTISGTLTGEEARSFYEEVVSNGPNQAVASSGQSVMGRARKGEGRLSRKRRATSRQRQLPTKKRGFVSQTTANPSRLPSQSQLFRFAQEGSLEELRAAIEVGQFDVDTVDSFNWSLLMCAASAGHTEVVHWLLRQGAQWRGVMDQKGNDAPWLARLSGHESVARLIEEFNPRQESSEAPSSTRSEPFYCEICKQTVSTSAKSSHDVSTVHQFSCQHTPHASNYIIPHSNRGFQMMVRGGWDPGKGLGSDGQGRQFPVKTVLKQDRYGLGVPSSSSRHPRVTHFSAHDVRAVKRRKGRRQQEEDKPRNSKRERARALEKKRGWEIRLRRYMDTD